MPICTPLNTPPPSRAVCIWTKTRITALRSTSMKTKKKQQHADEKKRSSSWTNYTWHSVMQQSGQTKTIYNTIFLKRFSLFHANGLDNPFGVRRKDLGDITYTSRVIAIFVSNFVAITTGVGRGRICIASFNSTTLKTPYWAQASQQYFLHKLNYSVFCFKFRCYGYQGRMYQTLTSFNCSSPKTPY